MIITEDLRKEIKDDIAKCESHTEAKGSESLYGMLVAKYSVLDSDFGKSLSTNGKAAVLGSEFDYRQELKAITAKLRMWLLSTTSSSVSPDSNLNPLKAKVDSFIKRGEEILIKEKHIPERGIVMPSYISGPLLDAWMGEINIFNERYLKIHPLYNSILATYSHYKKQFSACEDMLGHLRALTADDEFWRESEATSKNDACSPKTVGELLSEDISRCEKYISDPSDETFGRELYLQITGRYDSLIKDFGHGLYSYFSEQHFYDPNISISTVVHNLKLLLQKMISYQSQKYTEQKSSRKEVQEILSNKIFIVHGHDEAAKETMARTLQKAGFEAIILHEQASSGNTIIEKIERFSDVPFAVVLYTECDLGRAKEKECGDERYRARQNVVFEHGYLIGRLGRERVCALVKGNVETPGDISGVVYILMDDAGAWKYELAKEMRDAGLSVDSNKF